jgi:hypothetical protein
MEKRHNTALAALFRCRMGNMIVPHITSPKYGEDSGDPEIGRENLNDSGFNCR